MATRLKLSYGLQDDRLVHISQVANGLACACICPGCDARLIARNQGKRKVAHFAHYNAPECTHGLQTALHLAAKDIILKHQTFLLPGKAGQFEFTDSFWNTFSFNAQRYLSGLPTELAKFGRYAFKSRYLAIDHVVLERKTGDIIPDIVLLAATGPMLVEIAVTHFIDEQKSEKIRQLGFPTIEIDLSGVERDIALDELEQLLINGVAEKQWAYNAKLEAELATRRNSYFNSCRAYFETTHQARLEQRAVRLENRWPKAERPQRRRHQKRVYERILLHHKLLQLQQQRREQQQVETILFPHYLRDISLRVVRDVPYAPKQEHVDTCPKAPRRHGEQPYASVKVDCRSCDYFRGRWSGPGAIVCLFNHYNPLACSA